MAQKSADERDTARLFPGGSKSRVDRAGSAVRAGKASPADLRIIEEWRAAHRGVLNAFQAILRNRTRRSAVTVAQRHKRRLTIFDKLNRLPNIRLSQMDDIAGCRLIFPGISELRAFRASLHRAKFDHIRRNTDDKYDYIKSPKSSGYRGIHDVYECHAKSEGSQAFNGLCVEIQYRTLVQHAWATAGEVIGLITKNKPKFGAGNRLYGQTLLLGSEILSRAFEGGRGYLTGPDDHTICLNFARLNRRTTMLDRLRRLKGISVSELLEGNPILMFSGNGDLKVFPNKGAVEGLRTLFRLEKQFPARDIVLVRSTSGNGVRIAFKNYFSDALDFITLVEEGCKKLAGETLEEILEPRDRMDWIESTSQKTKLSGWFDPEQNTFFPA